MNPLVDLIHIDAHARILLVDDKPVQLKSICDILSDRGFVITSFLRPSEALMAMERQKFDLLLTDLTMPEMNGIEFMQGAFKIDPEMVAVMMTGDGTIDSAVEAMKAGALDYILKPLKLNIVVMVLTRALAIRRLRLENRILERQVRERTIELEAANHDLEAFSHSVSHDLRAPLRRIDFHAEVLLDDNVRHLSGPAQLTLRKITESTEHLRRLIDGLLAFAKLGRQTIAKEKISVRGMVNEIVGELQLQQTKRNVEVRLGELPDCFGDPILVRQVFVNLLSNAFKFTQGRVSAIVDVGSRRENEELIYFVRDNGAGFDMEYAHRLFGVFQRLHGEAEFEGTGVGLSIVQRVIQRHGGRVWAEGATDKGATFFFTLRE